MAGESNKITLEEEQAIKTITGAKIFKKFCLYGFFKNLQFFEPFLLIIFINWGLTLFQIGLLITIQEVFTYLFEIPSGFLADNYGKKKELLLCFVFYIISFIFYFNGPTYFMIILGAIFYGLGESFRSGTHKAMEIQWLDQHDLLTYKSYLYGRTRSWSLYGSALNSVIAIILVLTIEGDNYIFLFAIVPFLIDFLLIASYPKSLDKPEKKCADACEDVEGSTISKLKIIYTDPEIRSALFQSSIYDSVFKTLKHYIQPIMNVFIGIILISSFVQTADNEYQVGNFTFIEADMMKIILASIYLVFYLLSSFSTKRSFAFMKFSMGKIGGVSRTKKDKEKLIIKFFLIAFALLLGAISFFIYINQPLVIILLYSIMYVLFNMRRPIMVGYIGELAPKDQRATILSIDSQLKALFVFMFAPLFGYIADVSLGLLFMCVSLTILIFTGIVGIFKKRKQ